MAQLMFCVGFLIGALSSCATLDVSNICYEENLLACYQE